MHKNTYTILGYQTIIMWVISVVISFDLATVDNIVYFTIWWMAAPMIAVGLFVYAYEPKKPQFKAS